MDAYYAGTMTDTKDFLKKGLGIPEPRGQRRREGRPAGDAVSLDRPPRQHDQLRRHAAHREAHPLRCARMTARSSGASCRGVLPPDRVDDTAKALIERSKYLEEVLLERFSRFKVPVTPPGGCFPPAHHRTLRRGSCSPCKRRYSQSPDWRHDEQASPDNFARGAKTGDGRRSRHGIFARHGRRDDRHRTALPRTHEGSRPGIAGPI